MKREQTVDYHIERVHHLVFLTSCQCIIYDKEGDQIAELQREFTSGQSNLPLLKRIAEKAERHTLVKYREWWQDMDKEDFMRITHLNCVEKEAFL